MALYQDDKTWIKESQRTIAQQWKACGEGKGLAIDPTAIEMTVDQIGHGMSDDERLSMVRGIMRLLDFIWQDGPRPLSALQRLYLSTRRFSPDHVLHMNKSQIGVMLNRGRATTGAADKVIAKKLRELLANPKDAPRSKIKGEKSKAGKASLSRAQKGNCNRIGGEAAQRKYTIV